MPSPLARLASLDQVRGFVAVGRRMSITLAAQDLFLTQSAVSRQIHGLKEALGTKLFARGDRSLTFTTDGERLFRIADSAVQQLQDAFGSLPGAGGRLPVTVTASLGVSGLWLLPRLGRFRQNTRQSTCAWRQATSCSTSGSMGSISRSGTAATMSRRRGQCDYSARRWSPSPIRPWTPAGWTCRRRYPTTSCSSSTIPAGRGCSGRSA